MTIAFRSGRWHRASTAMITTSQVSLKVSFLTRLENISYHLIWDDYIPQLISPCVLGPHVRALREWKC